VGCEKSSHPQADQFSCSCSVAASTRQGERVVSFSLENHFVPNPLSKMARRTTLRENPLRSSASIQGALEDVTSPSSSSESESGLDDLTAVLYLPVKNRFVTLHHAQNQLICEEDQKEGAEVFVRCLGQDMERCIIFKIGGKC